MVGPICDFLVFCLSSLLNSLLCFIIVFVIGVSLSGFTDEVGDPYVTKYVCNWSCIRIKDEELIKAPPLSQ